MSLDLDLALVDSIFSFGREPSIMEEEHDGDDPLIGAMMEKERAAAPLMNWAFSWPFNETYNTVYAKLRFLDVGETCQVPLCCCCCCFRVTCPFGKPPGGDGGKWCVLSHMESRSRLSRHCRRADSCFGL